MDHQHHLHFLDPQGRLTAGFKRYWSFTDDGVRLGTDTLTFTGGTGIDTQTCFDSIDSTVATLTFSNFNK